MVKAMNARITILAPGREPLIIRMPESVRIEKSWRSLTDTAIITLPRAGLFDAGVNIRETFAVGAAVYIELGFNMEYVSKFKGYVIKVSDDLPITISCEDEMWKLKKERVNIATRKTFLPDFIKSITTAPIKAVAAYELGALRFANTTTAKVLEYLQSELNLYSYFDNGQLVVGEIYADDSGVDPVSFDLDSWEGNNLTYEDRESAAVKVTAVSTLSNGSKIEVSVGDPDGLEQRTAHYNITSKQQLTKLAEEDLRKYSRSRYTGSFETYGDFAVEHGYKVNVTSSLYPERDGQYYCDKTIIDFDSTPKYRVSVGLDELVQ